jgi:hypothetical protein
MSIYLIPWRFLRPKIIMREIAMETKTERRKTNPREIVFVHAMELFASFYFTCLLVCVKFIVALDDEKAIKSYRNFRTLLQN